MLGHSPRPPDSLPAPQFEECLARELQQIQEHRTEFVKDFSQTDYDALVTGWQVGRHPCCSPYSCCA